MLRPVFSRPCKRSSEFQELFEEFCEEFTREINRLRMEQRASMTSAKREVARIGTRIKKLLNLMLDDEIAVDEGKVEMKALDGRRKELEAQLKTADEPPALLHPEMARIYRTKVTELAEALQQPESRLEATGGPARSRGRYRADSKREQGGTQHRTSRQPGRDARSDRTNEEVAGIRRPLLASIFGCGGGI